MLKEYYKSIELSPTVHFDDVDEDFNNGLMSFNKQVNMQKRNTTKHNKLKQMTLEKDNLSSVS